MKESILLEEYDLETDTLFQLTYQLFHNVGSYEITVFDSHRKTERFDCEDCATNRFLELTMHLN